MVVILSNKDAKVYGDEGSLVTTVEPLLSGHLLNDHTYKAASNQSPDEGLFIVFTSIKRPAPIKRPIHISPRVAV